MKREIVYWCAKECERQHTGPMSVADMFSAWQLARLLAKSDAKPDLETILALGAVVEPLTNADGFRKTPVVFANGNWGASWDTIHSALNRLIENVNPCESPVEYYKAFQKIHPFQDGNGRVGAILFNWSDLENPISPPDFFSRK